MFQCMPVLEVFRHARLDALLLSTAQSQGASVPTGQQPMLGSARLGDLGGCRQGGGSPRGTS
jgi:hypothetical protein